MFRLLEAVVFGILEWASRPVRHGLAWLFLGGIIIATWMVGKPEQ